MSNRFDLDNKKKDIISLYKSGFSSTKVAIKFNTNRQTILAKLKKWKINLNKRNYYKFSKGINHYNWKGYKQIPKNFLTKAKRAAKIRNLPFNISLRDIWFLYLQQNKVCCLTGEILIFDSKSRLHDENISLDRKNNKIGYSRKNCQLVTKDINIAKNILSDEQFKILCRKVVNYDKS